MSWSYIVDAQSNLGFSTFLYDIRRFSLRCVQQAIKLRAHKTIYNSGSITYVIYDMYIAMWYMYIAATVSFVRIYAKITTIAKCSEKAYGVYFRTVFHRKCKLHKHSSFCGYSEQYAQPEAYNSTNWAISSLVYLCNM